MAAYTYDQFRKVIKRLGFFKARSRKHETWLLLDATRPYRKVTVKHQQGKTIPEGLFRNMLAQAGLTQDEFDQVLRGSWNLSTT